MEYNVLNVKKQQIIRKLFRSTWKYKGRQLFSFFLHYTQNIEIVIISTDLAFNKYRCIQIRFKTKLFKFKINPILVKSYPS